MKRILIGLLLFPGMALAAGDMRPTVSCGSLMTETECLQHWRTLAKTKNQVARDAYLEQHTELLREREVMCAASREQVSMLERAHYR